jgi:hypothetical protein
MKNQTPTFSALDRDHLFHVVGGAARVTGKSSGNSEITTMLTQVTSSIKDLAKGGQSGQDPMQMMMMMMMMGGMGGGGGGGAPAQVAPPPPPAAPVVSIKNSIR